MNHSVFTNWLWKNGTFERNYILVPKLWSNTNSTTRNLIGVKVDGPVENGRSGQTSTLPWYSERSLDEQWTVRKTQGEAPSLKGPRGFKVDVQKYWKWAVKKTSPSETVLKIVAL